MKNRTIAFNIARPNWYRVIASTANEFLRRGWSVQCWHGFPPEKFLKLSTLRPFQQTKWDNEKPVVFEYKDSISYQELAMNNDVDVVVDADLIPIASPEIFRKLGKRPMTVLIDGITNPVLQYRKKFIHYDIYAAPSKWHVAETIKFRERNSKKVIDEINSKLGRIADKFCQQLLEVDRDRWSAENIEYYSAHTVITGTPSLEDLNLVSRDKAKKKWGIPLDTPVVGVLVSPYDVSSDYLWAALNRRKNFLSLILLAIKHKQIASFRRLLESPTDKEILKAIKQFCKNNRAILMGKLRHSRSPLRYHRHFFDIIVGEEGYHPHTALEFFSVSDIVLGFTSSGAYECIAAGTSYVDIILPFYPKEESIEIETKTLEVTNEWPGCVWSFKAEEIVKDLKNRKLGDFTINRAEKKKYLSYFTDTSIFDGAKRLANEIEFQLNKTQ